MKDLLKDILEEMKDRVIDNLETVKAYEADINRLKSAPETYARAFNLQLRRKRSRQLLNDNLDYLELQLKIISFVDKYRDQDILKTTVKPLIDKNLDYFKETIERRIAFNERHPLYDDEKFINRLMEYYILVEDYKSCEEVALARIKSNHISK